MKKILKYLSLIVPLIVALGSVVILTILITVSILQAMIFAGIYMGMINPSMNSLGFLENIPDYTGIVIEILTIGQPLIWIVIFYFWNKKLVVKDPLPKVKFFSVKNIGLMIMAGLSCQLLIEGLMSLILPHFEKIAEDYYEMMEIAMGGNQIIMFISVVFLAPVSEELIFRGVIQKKALSFAPVGVAIFLQALLFGAFHMNIVQGTYAFLGGLAMGYIAYKYRSTLASMLFHLFFNALSYVMSAPETQFMVLSYTFGGTILLIVTILLVKAEGDRRPAILQQDSVTTKHY